MWELLIETYRTHGITKFDLSVEKNNLVSCFWLFCISSLATQKWDNFSLDVEWIKLLVFIMLQVHPSLNLKLYFKQVNFVENLSQ